MENQLVKVIQATELDKTKAQIILDNFTSFFEQAKEWEIKAKTLVVTDLSQVKDMEEAREARLALKGIRVNAEHTRASLKEQSLREGKAIDGIANVIKALIVPIEEHLEKQEKFAEIREQERKERINAERIAELQPFVDDTSFYNLKEMTDEAFTHLLETSRIAFEVKQEAVRKLEKERIAKEKAEGEERERIRVENERLKREAEAREKEIAVERAKAETERRKLEEQQRKEREAREKAETALKVEQEAKENAKREAEAKVDAERKAKAEAEKQARLAPDKDKLAIWADSIKNLPTPQDLSPEALVIANNAEKELLAIAQRVKEQIKSL